jgi:hypothetical protein
MKSRKSSPNSLAALALAAPLAVLSGCSCCPKVSTVAAGKPAPVNVLVQLTRAGIFVFPDHTHLGVGRQFPVWVLSGAPDGSCLDVKFKKEDPLEPEPREITKAAEGPCKTVIRRGVPKPGTEEKVFPYGVTVTLPDGTPITLDPDIEIDR